MFFTDGQCTGGISDIGEGAFQSPGYPDYPYEPNLDQCWLISAEFGQTVK